MPPNTSLLSLPESVSHATLSTEQDANHGAPCSASPPDCAACGAAPAWANAALYFPSRPLSRAATVSHEHEPPDGPRDLFTPADFRPISPTTGSRPDLISERHRMAYAHVETLTHQSNPIPYPPPQPADPRRSPALGLDLGAHHLPPSATLVSMASTVLAESPSAPSPDTGFPAECARKRIISSTPTPTRAGKHPAFPPAVGDGRPHAMWNEDVPDPLGEGEEEDVQLMHDNTDKDDHWNATLTPDAQHKKHTKLAKLLGTESWSEVLASQSNAHTGPGHAKGGEDRTRDHTVPFPSSSTSPRHTGSPLPNTSSACRTGKAKSLTGRSAHYPASSSALSVPLRHRVRVTTPQTSQSAATTPAATLAAIPPAGHSPLSQRASPPSPYRSSQDSEVYTPGSTTGLPLHLRPKAAALLGVHCDGSDVHPQYASQGTSPLQCSPTALATSTTLGTGTTEKSLVRGRSSWSSSLSSTLRKSPSTTSPALSPKTGRFPLPLRRRNMHVHSGESISQSSLATTATTNLAEEECLSNNNSVNLKAAVPLSPPSSRAGFDLGPDRQVFSAGQPIPTRPAAKPQRPHRRPPPLRLLTAPEQQESARCPSLDANVASVWSATTESSPHGVGSAASARTQRLLSSDSIYDSSTGRGKTYPPLNVRCSLGGGGDKSSLGGKPSPRTAAVWNRSSSTVLDVDASVLGGRLTSVWSATTAASGAGSSLSGRGSVPTFGGHPGTSFARGSWQGSTVSPMSPHTYGYGSIPGGLSSHSPASPLWPSAHSLSPPPTRRRKSSILPDRPAAPHPSVPSAAAPERNPSLATTVESGAYYNPALYDQYLSSSPECAPASVSDIAPASAAATSETAGATVRAYAPPAAVQQHDAAPGERRHSIRSVSPTDDTAARPGTSAGMGAGTGAGLDKGIAGNGSGRESLCGSALARRSLTGTELLSEGPGSVSPPNSLRLSLSAFAWHPLEVQPTPQ